MSEVWFIRHAQSTANAGEVTSDTNNTPLSILGRQQREDVSHKIIREPDLIVATPYVRAKQTSKPTRKKFPNARYEIWDLHEFCMLDLDKYKNKTSDQRQKFNKEYWNRNDPDYIDGEGAESFNQVTGRINDGFEKLKKAKEDYIVVFTHGRIMHIMRFMLERSFMTNKEMMAALPDYCRRQEVANCEIIRTTANENGITMFEEERAIFEKGFTQPYRY